MDMTVRFSNPWRLQRSAREDASLSLGAPTSPIVPLLASATQRQATKEEPKLLPKSQDPNSVLEKAFINCSEKHSKNWGISFGS